MFKKLSQSLIACSMALGVLSLSPLTAPSAFRAQAAFEQCFNDTSFTSPTSNQTSTYNITAHHNISQFYRYVDVYWVDFNGKWIFYKKLFPGQSYSQQTYVGHQWVAKTDAGDCEYFSIQQPWGSYNIGEYLN